MKNKLLCALIVFSVLLGSSACGKVAQFKLLQLDKIGAQDVTFMDDKYIVSDGADAYDFYDYEEKEDQEEPKEDYPSTHYQEVCSISCDWDQYESVSWERNSLACFPSYESDGTEISLRFDYYTTLSMGEYYGDDDYKDINPMEAYLKTQSDNAVERAERYAQYSEDVTEPKQGSVKKADFDDHQVAYIVTEYSEFDDHMIQIDTYEQRDEDAAFCVSIEYIIPGKLGDEAQTVDYERSIKDTYGLLSFTKEYKDVTAGSPVSKKTVFSPNGQMQCTENYSDISSFNLDRMGMTVFDDDANITLEFWPYSEDDAVQSILQIDDYSQENDDYYLSPDEMEPIEYEGQKFLFAKKIYDNKNYDMGYKECYYLTSIEDSVFKITYSEVKLESVKGEDLDEQAILDEVMKNITLESTSSEKSESDVKNVEKQISKCWSGICDGDEYAFFLNEDETCAGYIKKRTSERSNTYVGDLTKTEKEISVSERTYKANEYVITDDENGNVSVTAFEMSGKLWIYDEQNGRLFSLDPSDAEGFTKLIN